jgi:ribulose-5-phosphate 4-epimerase/fuculose-1-phosphate aldolase
MDYEIDNLIELSKKLSRFVVGAEGNVSTSYEEGIIIKGSGKSLSNPTPNDFVYVKGDHYVGDLKPSMEYKFHDWIIKNLNVKYVSHTHPSNTLKMLCSKNSDDFAIKRLFPDQVVFNGDVSCVVEYFTPGDDLYYGVINSVESYIKKNNKPPKLILLKNHGIITFGNTIQECVVSSEICEKSAEIFLGSLPNPSYLSTDDIITLTNDENEKYRLERL